MSGWTEERVAEASKMWREGYSAGVIADTLGGGLTRNSVIGKMHRLNVETGTTHRAKDNLNSVHAGQITKIATARQKARQEKRKPVSAAKPPAIEPPAPAPPPEPALPPISSRVPLEGLTLRSCRWPIGDPREDDFRFCGAPGADMLAIPPRPYCEHHARRAFSCQGLTPAKRKSSDKHTAWIAGQT